MKVMVSVLIGWLLKVIVSVLIGQLIQMTVSVWIGWLLKVIVSVLIGWLLKLIVSDLINWLSTSFPFWHLLGRIINANPSHINFYVTFSCVVDILSNLWSKDEVLAVTNNNINNKLWVVSEFSNCSFNTLSLFEFTSCWWWVLHDSIHILNLYSSHFRSMWFELKTISCQYCNASIKYWFTILS